jgi:DNA polymerase-3 subunit alpha
LVILTGCSSSFLNIKDSEPLFSQLKKKLKEDIYLELMPHDFKEQKYHNKYCLELSKKYKIEIVGTNDCHYINAEDEETQQVLLAMQTQAKWNDKDRFKFNTKGLFLCSEGQMKSKFKRQGVLTEAQIEKCLSNTIEVAKKCSDFRIKKQGIFLPVVPKYKKENPKELLEQLTNAKLYSLFKQEKFTAEKRREYKARLLEELDLIEGKGFIPYFLIIKELIDWCKDNDIMTGAGRGSVGGCLVAYLLDITCVDPIKYNLLFSRFISADRNDLPDVDIDFQDSKRELVRQHLEELYGKNNIASISTFLSMKGKAAIRDVARVFDIPLKEVDTFAKTISYYDDDSILQACKTEEGKAFAKKYPQVIKHALKLEGTIKANGQHAAAVIISADDLTKGAKGNLVRRSDLTVSNWDMEDSEYMGLMKLDVLGLNTLSVLDEVKKTVFENHNKEIIFDKIPFDDKNIYKEIYNGNNTGIFQISAYSTDKLAQQLRADNIFLLSDLMALVRPGIADSGMTDLFLARKNGQEWEKRNKIFEEITKSTYGILVYQEQIMEVVYKMAGLSYSIADKIRKVISKKRDAKEFDQYKDMFIEGCLKQKLSKNEANDFWEMMLSYASYSFNKSHALSYAIMAYWTMWCKYYYPIEFLCANLNYGTDKGKEGFISEAHRLELTIKLPSINNSDSLKWQVKDGNLYIPLIEIKGIGQKMLENRSDKKEEIKEVKIKSKRKGFFDLGIEKISKPATVVKKGKLESILEKIVELKKEENYEELQKYFSFKIRRE